VLCKQRRPLFSAAAAKEVKKSSVVKRALLGATAPTRYSAYCSWHDTPKYAQSICCSNKAAVEAFLAEFKAKKSCVAINEDCTIAACIVRAAQ
jgi:hypothetical protein